MSPTEPVDFNSWSNNILSEISEKSKFIYLLESIVNDGEELERVRQESFIHNLGFTRLKLVGWDTSKYMLKLHIWNEDRSVNEHPELTIHNHLYDFSSAIITGNLKFDIYKESDEGLLMNKYINPLKPDKYVFYYRGKKNLAKQLSINLKAGSQYWLDYKTLHFASNATDSLTSTLCIQSIVKQKQTTIYTQNELSHSLPPSKRFDILSLKSIINNYLMVLKDIP